MKVKVKMMKVREEMNSQCPATLVMLTRDFIGIELRDIRKVRSKP